MVDEKRLIEFLDKCLDEWQREQSRKWFDWDEFIEGYVKPLIKKMFGDEK